MSAARNTRCSVNEIADHVNVTKLKGCEVPPLPRHDPYWSHSLYCPNWNYVRDFTQDLAATRNTYTTLAGALFVPIGAGFADKQGRKPVAFFNFLMGMKSLLINLLSSTGTRLPLVRGYLVVLATIATVSSSSSSSSSSSCSTLCCR